MRQRGFTLIELLVTLVLVGIVLAAAGSLLYQSLNSEVTYRQQNSVQQNARTALSMIADDMRGAVRNPALRKADGTAVAFTAGASTAPVNTVQGATGATPTNSAPLYFDSRDDAYPSNARRVRYWLNGTDLRREIVSGTVNATSGNDSTTAAAATSATAGTIIARNIVTFTPSKPNGNNIVRILIWARQIGNANYSSNTTSLVKFQTDISLRNNLFD